MWYQANVEGCQPLARFCHSSTIIQRNGDNGEMGRVVLYGGKNNSPRDLSFISIGIGCTEEIAKPQNKQSLAKLGKLLGGAASIATNAPQKNVTTTTSTAPTSFLNNPLSPRNIQYQQTLQNQQNQQNNNNNNNNNSSFTKQRKTYSKLPMYSGPVIFHSENSLTDGHSPGMRLNHSMVAINSGIHKGKIILYGGTDEDGNMHFSDDLFILDSDQLWWERIKPTGQLPALRHSHFSFQISNDSIIIFGGIDCNNLALNDIHILTLTPQNLLKWSQPNITGIAPDLRNKNYKVGYCNNAIWVVQADGNIYKFDTVNFKWNAVQYKGKSPISNDKTVSCTSYANYLVLLVDNDIYFFDTVQLEWLGSSVDGELPMKRKGHSIAMVGTMLVVAGGQCEYPLSTVFTKDIEVIDLKPFLF